MLHRSADDHSATIFVNTFRSYLIVFINCLLFLYYFPPGFNFFISLSGFAFCFHFSSFFPNWLRLLQIFCEKNLSFTECLIRWNHMLVHVRCITGVTSSLQSSQSHCVEGMKHGESNRFPFCDSQMLKIKWEICAMNSDVASSRHVRIIPDHPFSQQVCRGAVTKGVMEITG